MSELSLDGNLWGRVSICEVMGREFEWHRPPCSRSFSVKAKAVFTRATFGLFVARHRDWRRRATVTRHPNRCRGGCRSKWNMSHSFRRSDTVIYEAATQRPVDELVPTFHLVYRHSSVCQFPASLYLGHLRTCPSLSQRSLTERRSCISNQAQSH